MTKENIEEDGARLFLPSMTRKQKWTLNRNLLFSYPFVIRSQTPAFASEIRVNYQVSIRIFPS